MGHPSRTAARCCLDRARAMRDNAWLLPGVCCRVGNVTEARASRLSEMFGRNGWQRFIKIQCFFVENETKCTPIILFEEIMATKKANRILVSDDPRVTDIWSGFDAMFAHTNEEVRDLYARVAPNSILIASRYADMLLLCYLFG